VLIKLEYNEGTVYHVDQSCLTVWYPINEKVDNLSDLNDRFRGCQFELVEVPLDDAHPTLPEDIYQDTIDTINQTLPKLKSRLESHGTARSPDVAMVLCDDAVNWPYVY